MHFVLSDAIMGLLGGLLIGLAAAIFLVGLGRVAGISGIAASLVDPEAREGMDLKLPFLAGLIGAPLLYALLVARPEIGITTSPALLVVAGLLVGLGTRIGNGCTSGHGVCGLSRFSVRSLVATLSFMAVAALVAVLVRPLVVGA